MCPFDMQTKWVCLIFIVLFSSSAVVADDERVSSSVISPGTASSEGRGSNEISAVGITQFTRPALGMADYGATPTMQSSKVSYGGSVEYRHWFGNNGLAMTYSVVASDGNFVSTPSSWRMSLTRHEGVVSYVRRFFPYSKFRPYGSIGAGSFLTHGGFGVWSNGTWIPQPYLGADGQFELRAAIGFDVWQTRHFGIRTGYVAHWFRAPNFSDVTYRGARTFITEPQIGFIWRF